MKKLFTLFILLVVQITFTNAQNVEVPTTQSPVLIKVAASWCPPCGSWGWDFFDDIYADNKDKSTLITAHHSGDYQSATSVDIKNNFSVFGQPIFLFDGVDQNVGSSNASSKRSAFASEVDTQSERNPDVQTGIEATYNNDKINIKHSTKFFNAVSGEYYLGIYIVEKIVVGPQASRSNDSEHKNILREEVTGNSFGNQIVSGSVDAQQFFDGSIDIDLGSYNPENLEIVSIIWKKEGNSYSIINSNSDKEISKNNTSANFSIEGNISSFKVYPTIFSQNSTIQINSTEQIDDTNITLYDSYGKKISEIYSGKLNIGKNTLNFDIPNNLSSSIYFIGLSAENIPNIIRRIVIQN